LCTFLWLDALVPIACTLFLRLFSTPDMSLLLVFDALSLFTFPVQTEVLAAARAALGTSADAGPDTSSSGPGRAAGSAAAVLERPPPPAAAAASSPASSSRQAGVPQAGSSSSPAAAGSSGSNASSPGGSSDGGGEPLTRRWSPLAEDQDLTRHVLQNALDQMQASGAPIAAPKDEEEEPPAGPASSSSSSGLQPPSSSGRGGGGGSTGSSSRSSRDIRSGRTGVGSLSDDGHGPAPSWAKSLLGGSPIQSLCPALLGVSHRVRCRFLAWLPLPQVAMAYTTWLVTAGRVS
jgi:hypothetical protein